MTIKKIGLSALAASIVASSVFAGTAKVETKTIASELLSDNNATALVDINSSYAPKLNAGINDGKIVVEFSNVANLSDYDDVSIYNEKSSETVTNNVELAGADNNKLIFDINGSVNDGDTLVMKSGEDLASINMTMLQGSSSVEVTFQTVNNNDTTLDTTAAGKLLEAKQQWSAMVESPMDAKIDAAADFVKFLWGMTSDSGSVKLVKTDLDFDTTSVNAYVYVKPDNNISKIATISLNGETPEQADSFEYNTTVASIDTNKSVIFAANDVNDTIPETTFTTSVKVFNDQFKTKTLLQDADFGKWVINGFNAQIPNVVGNEAIETTLKFTNSSSTDADIYVTMIDPAGETCSINSTTGAISSVKAGQTATIFASEMIKACTNANFDATGSFSVEVTIPTTPDKVYGFASFKNKTLGQFKDLPIYSNKGNSY